MSLRRVRRLFFAGPLTALLLIAVLIAVPLLAGEPGAAAAPSPEVAATVGDESVYVAEVSKVLADVRRGMQGRSVSPRIQAEALEQVINRRLVAQTFAQEGYNPTPEQLAALLAEFKRRLTTQQITFDEFLKRHGLTAALVERQLSWDSAWNLYLEQQMTDEALEKYFGARRREFDGSELRVSHVLLKVKDLDAAADVSAAIARAERLREQILAGKLTFAAAAEQHSAGPSRRQGGDLGFIARHGAMAEAFSAAAFRLKPGEISPPVVTPFGVHLIRCTDVKPGEQTWQAQRAALARAWSRDRFLQLASAARSARPSSTLTIFRTSTRRRARSSCPAPASRRQFQDPLSLWESVRERGRLNRVSFPIAPRPQRGQIHQARGAALVIVAA